MRYRLHLPFALMVFRLDFSRLQTREDLIAALHIEAELFDRILTFIPPPPRISGPQPAPSPAQDTARTQIVPFLRHDIPKKNLSRGHRTVWEPTDAMPVYKALARRFEVYLGYLLPEHPHPCVYGYRPGRNIRENARVHCGKQHLLKIDIADFFPSISIAMVIDFLDLLTLEPEVAGLLARFMTIGGSLPLGLPTSPVVSNGVMLPLDHGLSKLAELCGAQYTRYADDLTFSADDTLPDLDIVRDLLASQGFTLAEEKTHRSKRGQAHYVTGLSVSDSAAPHVPAQKKRQLRQQLYFATKFGLREHLSRLSITDRSQVQREVNRLDGMVKFVAHHEPQKSAALRASWRDILAASGLKPSFTPRGKSNAAFHLFLDEAEFTRGNETLLALGLAVTQHPQKLIDETTNVWRRAVTDLWADGDVDALKRNGLHFNDATEDLRRVYVDRLANMPFEGYIGFCPLEPGGSYEQTYIRILNAIITRRLMAADRQFAILHVEKNTKVSQDAIRGCVQSAFSALKESNNKRPLNVLVEFVAKPHYGISAPDFMLGVLGKYLTSAPVAPARPEPRYRLMFERLRDKYRLILDLDGWKEYSRRNPIAPWNP